MQEKDLLGLLYITLPNCCTEDDAWWNEKQKEMSKLEQLSLFDSELEDQLDNVDLTVRCHFYDSTFSVSIQLPFVSPPNLFALLLSSFLL